MKGSLLTVVVSVIALSFGLILGYLLNRYLSRARVESAEAEAKRLLTEAQTRAKELVLAAKDEALKLRDREKAPRSPERGGKAAEAARGHRPQDGAH